MVLSADLVSIMKNEGYFSGGPEMSHVTEEVQQFKNQIKPGRISAKTNKGIKLGMTETQVRNILGKPSRQIWSKKFEARELIYRREEKWLKQKQKEGGAEGMAWSNYYLFRNGKLYFIEFTQDYVGGA